MEGILIIILFIFQLISFFLIVLLNAKLNKYKNIEVKQQKMMEEMDNSIGVYLMEMKEENDRLIKELTSIQKPTIESQQTESLKKVNPTVGQTVKPKIVSPTVAFNVYKSNIEKQAQIEEEQILSKNTTPDPINPNFQNQDLTQIKTLPPAPGKEKKEMNFEETVIEMYRNGHTVDQIAKQLNKGTTEIELLIKFHM